jgi:hypothetical protein
MGLRSLPGVAEQGAARRAPRVAFDLIYSEHSCLNWSHSFTIFGRNPSSGN